MPSLETILDISAVILPALAYTILRCELPLPSGLLVVFVFCVDSLRRMNESPTLPARAFATDKRKVRRLDDATLSPTKEDSTLGRSRWSGLWILNAILTLCVLDHLSTPLITATIDPTYSRTSDLADTSAHISLRAPHLATTQLSYRLMAHGAPWQHSQPFSLGQARDWSADILLDGLSPGMQYEYTVQGRVDLAGNFTTFPNARYSTSSFRFLYAGKPAFRPLRYRLPRSFLQWRRDRLGLDAWHQWVDWVIDINSRTAWARPEFALMGGIWSARDAKRVAAAFPTAWDVLPVLPAYTQSLDARVPEPAALNSHARHFRYAPRDSHGNTHFFRLHEPTSERGQDDQDWRVDVEELRRELLQIDIVDWKIITIPRPIRTGVSSTTIQAMWDKAILDVLVPMTNVVVLSDSTDDSASSFQATLLYNSIVQIESPRLDGRSRRAFSFLDTFRTRQTGVLPLETSTSSRYQVLKRLPAGSANWVSLEVESHAVHVVLVRNGSPIWRLQITSPSMKSSGLSSSVGYLEQNFKALLRSLGLLSTRWF